MNVTVEPMTEEILQEMLSKERADRERHRLSDNDLAPLIRYIEHRIKPGGFLTAVLENDLRQAMGSADINNRRKVFEYVEWLYNEAPATCWGSVERVSEWLRNRADS